MTSRGIVGSALALIGQGGIVGAARAYTPGSRSRLASLIPRHEAEKVEANRRPVREVALDLGVRNRDLAITAVARAPSVLARADE